MRVILILISWVFVIACNDPADKTSPEMKDPTVPAIPANDTIFTGVGTEPFWAVYLININGDTSVVFHPAEGQESSFPLIADFHSEDSMAYHGSRFAGGIWLYIIKQNCSDGMSEIVYPFRVVVKIDGKNYRGCG